MISALNPYEVDHVVERMRPSKLRKLGSRTWICWHERLQNLNKQALYEAAVSKSEYVKDKLVEREKTPILVYEAILISAWKNNVLPLLLEFEPSPKTTFVAYAILYHEAIAVGLLELVMFHQDGCESLLDSAPDLLEYAYDSASMLLSLKYIPDDVRDEGEERDVISKQKDDLAFNVGIRCLSIIRYLSENLDRVPLDVTSKIYQDLDVPTLLIQLLLEKPWLKEGKIYKQGLWVNHTSEAISQNEAQVWLALRQILLDRECVTQYSITNSRRSQLQKLLQLLSPTIMDQISPLLELKHWLCQVAASNEPPAEPKNILLRSVSTIKRNILEGDDDWGKIAKEQIGDVFCTDKDRIFEVAQQLSSAFNTDLLEKFDLENNKTCSVCGNSAIQRCSRCKEQWYCSRNCQTRDWKNHRETCLS